MNKVLKPDIYIDINTPAECDRDVKKFWAISKPEGSSKPVYPKIPLFGIGGIAVRTPTYFCSTQIGLPSRRLPRDL